MVKGETADQNKTKEIYEQLDLFTMFMEQVPNVIAKQKEVGNTKPSVQENATDVKEDRAGRAYRYYKFVYPSIP